MIYFIIETDILFKKRLIKNKLHLSKIKNWA